MLRFLAATLSAHDNHSSFFQRFRSAGPLKTSVQDQATERRGDALVTNEARRASGPRVLALVAASAIASVTASSHAEDGLPPGLKQPSAPELPPAEAPEPPDFEGEAPEPSIEVSGEGSAPPGLPPELSGHAVESEELQVEEEGGALTIEEIVNTLVVSASNREESSLTAPAWVITLSRDDLKKRGYLQLDEFLDDLPGIDVIRPYGDVHFKDYWRGSRNDFASPYLLLVDGVVQNHLWYENTQVMASFPLSNIERVEVMFGPASAVYGPNAAMGVVNVITTNDLPEDGYKLTSRFGVQTPTERAFAVDGLRKFGDMHALVKRGKFRVSVATRFDYGTLDPNISEDFEFTKKQYYADRALWGPFVDNDALGGSFHSPSEKLSFDARLFYGGTELSAQLYRLSTGNGSVYPGDRVQTNPPITYQDLNFTMRHVEVRQRVSSTSLLRYRQSDVTNPTVYLERINEGKLEYSEGKLDTASVTAQQDLHIEARRGLIIPDDTLQFDLGLKYEFKDLERAFVGTFVQFESPAELEQMITDGARLGTLLPSHPVPGVNQYNRTPANNIGGYLLAKYGLYGDHWLNLGARVDYRELASATSIVVRGGYIGRFMDALTVKLLIGQSNQEPAARYRMTNNQLKNESSRTLELNGNYLMKWLAAMVDLYWTKSTNPIISGVLDDNNFVSANVESRSVVGLDLGVQALPQLGFVRQLKLWAYYSTYLYAQENQLVGPSRDMPTSGKLGDIGDLANHKLLGGLTLDFTRQVGVTVLGRFVSDRKTIRSNPAGNVPGYFTLDANLLFSELLGHGLMLAIRCTNILGTAYHHPGIKAANSGVAPVSDPTTFSSAGNFNSLLPQPGRAVAISIGTNL